MNHMPYRYSKRVSIKRTQRGVTLVVALIFLGVLALLGATAAQVMSLQERMAGNARSRDLAFQAAEAALADAEAEIKKTTSGGGSLPASVTAYTGDIKAPGSGGGLYKFNLCNPNSQAFWGGSGDKDCDGADVTAFNWSASGATRMPSVTISEVKEQPKYVVERFAPDLMPGPVRRFRVTARGVGGDDTAVVILQAIYVQ